MTKTESKAQAGAPADHTSAPSKRLEIHRISVRVPQTTVVELPVIAVSDRQESTDVTADSIRRPVDTWD